MEFIRNKILIVTSWYPDDNKPSQAIFVKEHAILVKKMGFEVTLVHCYLKGTFLSTILSRKTIISDDLDEGIRTIRIGVSPVFIGLKQLAYKKLTKQVLMYLNKLFKETQHPDFIHSHSIFMGGVVGLYLSKVWNIPLVHTEHSSGLIFKPTEYSRNDKRILKNVYQHAEKVLFVSNWFKNSVKDKYKLNDDNFTVIANPINSLFFKKKLNEIIKPNQFLIIGNFIHVKNHVILLKAWKSIIQNHREVKLILAGEGKLKLELQKLAKDLSISNSLIWKERQNREGILQLISASDVILSTSRVETFGMTIAEANAMGKPVICTDSGGVRDIVNHINGIITEQKVSSLVDGVNFIINNYHNYDSETIRQNTKDKFSEEIISNSLKKHYQKIIN